MLKNFLIYLITFSFRQRKRALYDHFLGSTFNINIPKAKSNLTRLMMPQLQNYRVISLILLWFLLVDTVAEPTNK